MVVIGMVDEAGEVVNRETGQPLTADDGRVYRRVTIEGFSLIPDSDALNGKPLPTKGALVKADVRVLWPRPNGSGKARRPLHFLTNWREAQLS